MVRAGVEEAPRRVSEPFEDRVGERPGELEPALVEVVSYRASSPSARWL